jgi:hypothetical protein
MFERGNSMNAIRILAVALVAGCAARAWADPPKRPVIVELFTSEGCSSCPPADALLTEFANKRHDVLPLAFHVTYWNSLGWTDPFSFEAATKRQEGYSNISAAGGPYTPQMVVDGTADVIGSYRDEVLHAIGAAASKVGDSVPVNVARDGTDATIKVGLGQGTGRVWLIGYDSRHTTPVGRGENAGQTLVESNVVRSLTTLGEWSGAVLDLHHALPAGEHLAVLLQAKEASDAARGHSGLRLRCLRDAVRFFVRSRALSRRARRSHQDADRAVAGQADPVYVAAQLAESLHRFRRGDSGSTGLRAARPRY